MKSLFGKQPDKPYGGLVAFESQHALLARRNSYKTDTKPLDGLSTQKTATSWGWRKNVMLTDDVKALSPGIV